MNHLSKVATLLCLFFLLTFFDRAISKEQTHIKANVWNKVAPFLLPEDHAIKPNLDQLFSSSRAILSIKAMKKAGFIHPKVRQWTNLVVVKHPQLPGYVIKTYLDAQRYHKNKPEYHYWILRIEGAHAIKKVIDENHWNHLFKVPGKWIYKLPDHPAPPREYLKKNFILVEDDMDLFDDAGNKAAWSSSQMVTKETLDALYVILKTVGLLDCVKIDNIPFSKDGRIAFIDTQTFNESPVCYDLLLPFLPKELQSYWDQLTE